VETFNVNDPTHGFVMLPKVLKKFIDHRYFQRLRYIRQLSMCAHVYPGATHNRFLHSIGTAYLAFHLVKHIRERQPDIEVSDTDVLCITLAALLHDIGHPCFSHMFETFVHRVGQKKQGLSDEQRKKYADFEHEDASIALVRLMWGELKPDLEDYNFSDADVDFVCLLISPPKKQLAQAMENGTLGQEWPKLISCRPQHKSWMFEIVSNWRSGLDVDRFDYFRRDAQHLGISKEFDHWRYIKTVRATFDQQNEIWTLSPPDKDKDFLREDMLELRRSLHRKAYQHKTTQKLEQHMIDILELMEKSGLTVRTAEGQDLALSAAAAEFNASAYVQLTDSFVESRLYSLQGPESPLQIAYEEYERRIIRRHMFRLLADFDVPPDLDFSAYGPTQIIHHTLDTYRSLHTSGQMDVEVPPRRHEEKCGIQDLDAKLFRCSVAEFHQGMKRKDPLMRVLFHSSKDPSQVSFLKASEEVPPLTQKVFLFYDAGPDAHNSLLFRQLVASFLHWAGAKGHEGSSQQKQPQSNQSPRERSPRKVSSPVRQSRIQNSPGRCGESKPPPRRTLSVRSSCPDLFDP
jgi:HD superfamily phosphohydrolase